MLVDLAVLFCLTDPLTAPKIPAEIVVQKHTVMYTRNENETTYVLVKR